MVIGKVITRDLVLRLLKMVGVRLTHAAGREVRAAGRPGGVGGADLTALRYVCDQHIRQCAEVARMLALPAPVE